MRTVTTTIGDLLLQRTPGAPALNKWLASYGMMCWLVLGTLLHGVMIRVWERGILGLKDYLPDADEGGGEAAEAVAVGRQDNEDAYRKQRKVRAARLRAWMTSPVTQLWSVVCLYVTAPIARLVGNYLKDEYMYVQRDAPVGSGRSDFNPWADPRDGASKQTPTLKTFVQGRLQSLRKMQCRVVDLMCGSDSAVLHIRSAFLVLGDEQIFAAVQQIALEAMA